MAKLKKGDKGPKVLHMKHMLSSLGYGRGIKIDETFDPKTEAAVKALQKAYGLTDSGVWSNDLMEAASIKPAQVKLPGHSYDTNVANHVYTATDFARKDLEAAWTRYDKERTALLQRFDTAFGALAEAAKTELSESKALSGTTDKIKAAEKAHANAKTIGERKKAVETVTALLKTAEQQLAALDKEVAEAKAAVAKLKPALDKVKSTKPQF